jgi:hypothetical protein
VTAAEPHCRERFRKLVNRLLHILLCGDLDGQHPAGDGLQPWDRDDTKPADVGTRARLQLTFPVCGEAG